MEEKRWRIDRIFLKFWIKIWLNEWVCYIKNQGCTSRLPYCEFYATVRHVLQVGITDTSARTRVWKDGEKAFKSNETDDPHRFCKALNLKDLLFFPNNSSYLAAQPIPSVSGSCKTLKLAHMGRALNKIDRIYSLHATPQPCPFIFKWIWLV